MYRKISTIAAAAAMAGLAAAAPAQAGSLVWTISSDHPNQVSLEFYSQDYSRAWPGGGQVYVIDDWDAHTYNLECQNGELICYGAWVRGDASTYWGVGLDNSYPCSDCCATCGAGPTQPITLRP